ncbi:hypothetical protein Nepgr_018014 [Nepenthes gracilis]|uniref:Uncharacterized protein n=1 Tax=Nepenthes gracilis TaxID=150966 RepID=A0AAD3SQH7_NEPGR|nr:hypothetical protein Nepgr_018014 [Nepenthes gracilis]
MLTHSVFELVVREVGRGIDVVEFDVGWFVYAADALDRFITFHQELWTFILDHVLLIANSILGYMESIIMTRKSGQLVQLIGPGALSLLLKLLFSWHCGCPRLFICNAYSCQLSYGCCFWFCIEEFALLSGEMVQMWWCILMVAALVWDIMMRRWLPAKRMFLPGVCCRKIAGGQCLVCCIILFREGFKVASDWYLEPLPSAVLRMIRSSKLN